MNYRASVEASAGLLTRPTLKAWQVNATQSVQYDVLQIDDLFERSNRKLLDACGVRTDVPRQVVIIEQHVDELYGANIRGYYAHHGVELCALVLRLGRDERPECGTENHPAFGVRGCSPKI